MLNPLNAQLNPICHLLALLGAHHIFHVSGLRVNTILGVGVILPSLGKKTVTWNSQECHVLLFMGSGCLFL